MTFRLPGAIFYLKLFEEVSLILILVWLVWHRLPSGLTLNLMMSNGAQMKPLGMNLGHPSPRKLANCCPTSHSCIKFIFAEVGTFRFVQLFFLNGSLFVSRLCQPGSRVVLVTLAVVTNLCVVIYIKILQTNNRRQHVRRQISFLSVDTFHLCDPLRYYCWCLSWSRIWASWHEIYMNTLNM